jgi:hypothetical protein
MKNMDSKSYRRIHNMIANETVVTGDDVLMRSVRKVKECMAALDNSLDVENSIFDIAVSFDGTWHKRGFTSHYGVGVVIEITTGLVIDYEVVSNYCHACELAKTKYHDNEILIDRWRK